MQHAGLHASAVHTLAVWAVLPSTGGRGNDDCLRTSAGCRRPDLMGRAADGAGYRALQAKARPNNLSRWADRREDIRSPNVSRWRGLDGGLALPP